MSLRIRAAALALAAVFGLAACSSSKAAPPASAAGTPSAGAPAAASGTAPPPSSAATSPSMTMTMTAPATTTDARPVAGNAVAIKGFAFSPAALTVKVGTTVTWTNADGDAHTVTSQDPGGPLQSAALATGQSYSYTFTKPGTYAYLCTIHPFMTATVTVTQ